ncbi:MAG: hypothetical protein E7514_02165 [Ruminococcaceae bacterium]|nr:hypothetical protein [Oscillospiraceae bacterium]
MKKGKWANLFGTALAGVTVGAVVTTGKHFAKKFGQKTNTNRLFDIKLSHLIDYGLEKFVNTPENEIIEKTELFTDND